jgi:uncharacterized membrane protein
MRAGILIFKYIKYLSLFAFIILLFVAYYYLPERIPYHYDPYGHADEFIDRSHFFYAAGIFVVLFNVALSLLAKLFYYVPARSLPIPNRHYWTTGSENRREFYEIVEDWLNCLAAFVNSFMVLCLYALLRINTSLEVGVRHYTWILPVGTALLIIWLFLLPGRLLIRRKALLG